MPNRVERSARCPRAPRTARWSPDDLPRSERHGPHPARDPQSPRGEHHVAGRRRAVLTFGGFALLGGIIGDINDENRRTNLLTEAEETLHLGLVTQQGMVIRHVLQQADGYPAGYDRALGEETDAYIQIGRLAADDPEILEASDEVRRAAREWRETWAEPFMREASENEFFQVRGVPDSSERAFAPVLAAVEVLDALTEARREEASQALAAVVDNQRVLIVPVIVAVSVIMAIGGLWLIGTISGPLHRLNRTAQALIAGEPVTFVSEKDDEIGALAVVLERMRIDAASRYDAARSEAETAATFNQLAELTSFAQNEETLVQAATRVLQRIAPSPRGQVMLLNNSTNRLIVAAAWGDGGPEIGSIADLDRTDRCPGIRRATAYVAEDVSDDLAVRCPAHTAESGSVVCLPMPALGSIVGVIHLERPEAHSFDGLTVQRAARIAEQVALAVANARLMKTMEGLANTDPLTGLRNARFFDAYLEQQFTLADRDSDSIAVLMLDVDHFKQFNDTYGHPAGDEALRALSRTMRGVIRASDVVARYGGEEFIIALHHASLKEAAMVAEKIREAVEHTVVEIGPGRYGRITVSLGVAATDAHHADRKGLVSLADAALYRAKHAGRNRVEAAPSATPVSDAHTAAAAEPVDLAVKRTGRASMRRRPAKPAADETA